MKSAISHLLDCANDTDTRERLRKWVGIYMVEMTQMIAVTKREIEHTGDQHESFMEMRREQAFRNMAQQIKSGKVYETEQSTHPNGVYEERIRILMVKPW